MSQELLSDDLLRRGQEKLLAAVEQLDKILLGQHELHKLVIIGILSRGHILLEGLPGVGKTALVKALGEILSLEFSRVQFTPDLLPGDITGGNILQVASDGSRSLEFQKGPIFTNILLADEINRASPKTQSAMLEAMQEHQVTSNGVTRTLPDPFFVLASQNPIELEGTYPVPEAQLDRFLFKLNVTHVDVETLTGIIASRRRGEAEKVTFTLSCGDLKYCFELMEKIHLSRPVASYIARLVGGAHPGNPHEVKSVTPFVAYGPSPRAAIAMAESARAAALLNGRAAVGFEDVKLVAPAVLCHRLILNYNAKLEKKTPAGLVAELLEHVPCADAGLPAGMAFEKE
jgi:MoxR-like ATPase